jgi:hypothetical protein
VSIDVAYVAPGPCGCGSRRFIRRTAFNAALDCSQVVACALCGEVDECNVVASVPVEVPRPDDDAFVFAAAPLAG